MDWYTSDIVSDGTIAIWDPKSVIMIEGPPRTAQYLDETTEVRGVRVSSPYMFGTDIPVVKGGHILTEDSDGNIKVFCKKMYRKIGKHKWKIDHREYATVTDHRIDAVVCGVCHRLVTVRDHMVSGDYRMRFKMPEVISL